MASERACKYLQALFISIRAGTALWMSKMGNTFTLKPLLNASLLLAAGVGSAPLASQPAWAQATTSSSASYDSQSSTQTIEFWRGRAQNDPQSAVSFRELASAYLARQRERGDIADAVRAEAAARQSLKILPGSNGLALSRLGRSLLTQHRFPEALAVANEALKIDPQAHRLRADVLLEMGDLPGARRAFQQAVAATNTREVADDLNLLTLRARILEAEGQDDEALGLMQRARTLAGRVHEMPAETHAWYHVMVGHALIDGGQLAAGEKACLQALKIFPRDHRAMTGMVEAAAWRGNEAKALEWGRKAIAIAPQNPEVLRLMGEMYLAQGQKAQAEQKFRALEALGASFPRIYDRHLIHLWADHGRSLDKALALARKDLKLRQDGGAYDALAWVSFKKGAVKDAQSLMQKALARPPHSVDTWHHAAVIARASGDKAGAKRYAARAKEANPYFVMEPTKIASATPSRSR
jgi:tetratricopeptide (TPR) repeat protein